MTTTEQAEQAAHDLRHGRIDELTMLNGADAIDALVVENERITAALAERDAEIGKLHAAMADLQDLESNARQKCDHWFERYQAKDAVIAAQRKVLEQALAALQSLFSWEVDPGRGVRCTEAITAIQEVLK